MEIFGIIAVGITGGFLISVCFNTGKIVAGEDGNIFLQLDDSSLAICIM